MDRADCYASAGSWIGYSERKCLVGVEGLTAAQCNWQSVEVLQEGCDWNMTEPPPPKCSDILPRQEWNAAMVCWGGQMGTTHWCSCSVEAEDNGQHEGEQGTEHAFVQKETKMGNGVCSITLWQL